MFSLDSKFIQVLGRVADLMMLNILFVLTSLPIVTAGAAWTALYDVCFRISSGRDEKMIRHYFRAFRKNFRSSTVLWIVLLFSCCITSFMTVRLFVMPGKFHMFYVFYAVLTALILFIGSYVFPLMSQFNNSIGKMVKNALVLSLGYAPRSILIVALNILPIVLLLVRTDLFLRGMMIWLLLYFSGITYLNTRLFRKVFQPYWVQEKSTQ